MSTQAGSEKTPEGQGAASYREAYATLSRIAAELEGGEADLDRVLPLLEEARSAYAQCQSRIEAVRAVLAGGWSEGPALGDAADDATDDELDEAGTAD